MSDIGRARVKKAFRSLGLDAKLLDFLANLWTAGGDPPAPRGPCERAGCDGQRIGPSGLCGPCFGAFLAVPSVDKTLAGFKQQRR